MARTAAAGYWSRGRALARTARYCLGAPSLLAAAGLLIGLTWSGICKAEPVRGEATFAAAGGYARLVIKLAEAVDSVSKLSAMRSVQLSFIADWNPLVVEGNRVRLGQVFITFLTNAAKATESGSTIRVSAVSDDGWVVVRVWDTGPGLSSDSLPKLFDRLLADNSDGANEPGVALMVARQIIEAHGGKLTARTEGLEFGCEYTARLPRVDSIVSEL